MTFSLAGLLGNSAPGQATGIDRSTTNLTALANLNALSPQNVPQIAPVATTVAPVETNAENTAVSPAVAEAEEFDTLAQAVAAQDSAAADEALQCLAGAIYFESKGEPLTGHQPRQVGSFPRQRLRRRQAARPVQLRSRWPDPQHQRRHCLPHRDCSRQGCSHRCVEQPRRQGALLQHPRSPPQRPRDQGRLDRQPHLLSLISPGYR
jgi:hypothetical protein